METEEKNSSVQEWIIACDPSKYNAVAAFRELGTVDWTQSVNFAVGDIVYIYISSPEQALRVKCLVKQVDKKNATIDDSKYARDDKYSSKEAGRYVELEMVEELDGVLYTKSNLDAHGFVSPRGPRRVTEKLKGYLSIVSILKNAREMDPDKYDGSYELMRSVINAYENMKDRSTIDYNDLNLVYAVVIGTWCQGIDAKKKMIAQSHLPDNQQSIVSRKLDEVWKKAGNRYYENRENDVQSIGMFGTGFFSFKGKTDDASPKNFIEMCISITHMHDSDEQIYNRCEGIVNDSLKGVQAAAVSMMLHCLKPTVFPALNANSDFGTIYEYLKLDVKKVRSIATYIDNCRVISKFRDENFVFKNYRIFDHAARQLGGAGKTQLTGNISDFVDRILKEYKVEKKNPLKENPLANFICQKAPRNFYETNIIDENKYLVKGSVGQGNWATTPWLAVFDKSITTTATKGEYIVYLLSSDYQSLYLTFNQGCTELSKQKGKKEAISIMKKKALDVVSKIDNRGFEEGEIDLGDGLSDLGEYYAKGSIFSKKYVSGEIPSEEELQDDLSKMVDIYKEYVDQFAGNEPEDEEAVEIMSKNKFDKNMILYGPPGTGKTYSTAKYAVAICDELSLEEVDGWEYENVLKRYNELKEEKRVVFTTFHQSYGYEEFIEGIKPELDDDNNVIYKIEDGLFKKFCEIAGNSHVHTDTSNEEDRPYVFIIDEINRGNISKIFGELITLIEDTKRIGAEEEMRAVLPYSGKLFGVPDNVYILGTMNTADRSIALMDTALRRRFGFAEMMPDASLLDGVNIEDNGESVNVGQMLRIINDRITFLYDREHTIGHAFFMKLVEGGTVSDLAAIFEKSVVPLLKEYFYEDYEKIRLVLGDSAKKDKDTQFIQVDDIPDDLFDIDVSETIDISEEKNYTIAYKNFKKIMAYKGISKKL